MKTIQTYDIITGKEQKLKVYTFPMTFEYTRKDYLNAIMEMDIQDIIYIRDQLNKLIK